mmetsp:Transcript_22070/g.43790  ORF Transcript_22070/g.43790 Transcript_22070/m.43790 type:complete len:150 (+) Transcript_22070:199-648(+)
MHLSLIPFFPFSRHLTASRQSPSQAIIQTASQIEMIKGIATGWDQAGDEVNLGLPLRWHEINECRERRKERKVSSKQTKKTTKKQEDMRKVKIWRAVKSRVATDVRNSVPLLLNRLVNVHLGSKTSGKRGGEYRRASILGLPSFLSSNN